MTESSARQSVRAVLFDLDGTLIDSAPDLAAAADSLRTARGLPALPFQAYRPHAGAGARGLLGVALDITPQDGAFESMREAFFQAYEQRMTNETRVFDQVPELIDALRARGLRWGVVTNKIERFTQVLARRLALLGSADVLISGDTTAHIKPHPQPLLEAASRLGLPPQACVYVGDDERDIQAGRAAGMKTVAAAYGYLGKQAQPVAWGADLCIDDPLQLLKWLGVA